MRSAALPARKIEEDEVGRRVVEKRGQHARHPEQRRLRRLAGRVDDELGEPAERAVAAGREHRQHRHDRDEDAGEEFRDFDDRPPMERVVLADLPSASARATPAQAPPARRRAADSRRAYARPARRSRCPDARSPTSAPPRSRQRSGAVDRAFDLQIPGPRAACGRRTLLAVEPRVEREIDRQQRAAAMQRRRRRRGFAAPRRNPRP